MRIRLGNGLLAANVLGWLLIAVILLFPQSPVRIVLGIPFVLFFPGFALINALVPRKEGMSGIERVALSFGLSIAMVILIGLGLNYTPFGIRLEPIMYSMATVLLLLSAVAWSRARRLPADQRFSVSFTLGASGLWGGHPIDRALSVLLILAILAAIGAIAYTIARPKAGEAFTEFYILGPGGKAEDYPSQISVGDNASVTCGIVSHLRQATNYTIEVTVAGTKTRDVGPIELQPGEKWESPVNFSSNTTGTQQKVEFTLNESPQVDATPLSLHLWIDVVP